MLYSISDLNPSEDFLSFGEDKAGTPVFVLPPIEGTTVLLQTLLSQLPSPVHAFQCPKQAPLDSVQSLAQYYVEKIKKKQPCGPYRLIGYSFGACVALEVALQLQTQGPKDCVEKLVLLDGSHTYVLSMIGSYSDSLGSGDSAEVETAMVCGFVDHIVCRLKAKVLFI